MYRKDNDSWRVWWWENDKRKSKDFKKKSDAIDFANDRNAEYTLPSEIVVSMDDRIALAQLRKYGDMQDILKFLSANYKPVNIDITFIEAVRKFLAEKTSHNLRARTLSDYDIVFARLEKWNDKPLASLSESSVSEILSSSYKFKKDKKIETRAYSVSSNQRTLKTLSALFQWAIKNKFANRDPFKNFATSGHRRDKSGIKIFTPNQVQSLLTALPDNLKAGFAIMAFAGVRPAEIINDMAKPVLKWADIKMGHSISISGETSKIRAPRVLHALPDNLWKWLELTDKKDRKGNVISISYSVFRNVREKVCKGLKLKWLQDGLRHSFASYAWHVLGAEHTVEILGHEGGFEVLKKYYKGIATKSESEEYFKIVP